MHIAPKSVLRGLLQLNSKQTTRLAAVGDLHIKKTSQGALQPLLAPVNDAADMLLLCGDLTDYGLPEEAHILAKELTAAVTIPVVAVLGTTTMSLVNMWRCAGSSPRRASRCS